MPNKFASGKFAIAECDRCAKRVKLAQLRKLVIKTKITNIKVCPECWEADHPQLRLGMYPVNDPQAVREPRPDTSYLQSGLTVVGGPGEGSRNIQWGWNPVGGGNNAIDGGTPNTLAPTGYVGTVTVVV